MKEKINISIDPITLERLRQMAKDDDRSLSQYINLILKHHLEHLKKEKIG